MSYVTKGGRYSSHRARFWNDQSTPSKPRTEPIPEIPELEILRADEPWKDELETGPNLWSTRRKRFWNRERARLPGTRPSQSSTTHAQNFADKFTFSSLLPQSPIGITDWRKGILYTTIAVSCVLIANLSLLIYSLKEFKSRNGVVTIRDSDCDSIHSLSFWMHMLINFLATVLLAGSNYCMQRLCAPSRSEVDASHRKLQWLDIGTPSARNFHSVSSTKRLLWYLLAFSSIPLHLM